MNAYIEKAILSTVQVINHCIPKKENSIIFYSSPDYSDNCRAMYETIRQAGMNHKYHITWVVQDVERYQDFLKDDHITIVKHRSLYSLFRFCRAKYIIRTHSLWGNRYIKKRQVMCIAWHGIDFKGPSAYEKRVCPKTDFDYFCVTSEDQRDKFSGIYKADKAKFCVSGLPRNDYMFRKSMDLLDSLQLSAFSKLILWMPTYRESPDNDVLDVGDIGVPIVRATDLPRINERLKSLNYCLLLKLHPFSEKKLNQLCFSNIKLIKNKDIPIEYSLYQLIGSIDAMISDYSSSWCDFLLMNRPIGFAYDDLEEYLKVRDVPYRPIEEYMPGMKIHSVDGLIHFFDTCFTNDEYSSKRNSVANILFKDFDNNSSERFLRQIGLL